MPDAVKSASRRSRACVSAGAARPLLKATRRNSEAATPEHKRAQALHYVLDSQQLSATEKDWLLGRIARQVLSWSTT
jgi:hypothetical protein